MSNTEDEVTELEKSSLVRAKIRAEPLLPAQTVNSIHVPKKLITRSNTIRVALYGTGGHSSVVASVLSNLNLKIHARYDDDPARHIAVVDGISVEPGAKTYGQSGFVISNMQCTICIGNNAERKFLSQRLQCDYLTLIDPSAIVSETSVINYGTVVIHRAIIQANSIIGRHVIINSGASVDHDNTVCDFAHISTNATLCGDVNIGEGALIGAGAILLPQISVGKWSTIGAGAVVTKDVPNYCTVVGNPARIIKTTHSYPLSYGSSFYN